MLLAVDVGNSHTTVGVFTTGVLACELRLSTRRNWTSDELAGALAQALSLRGHSLADIEDAIVACVVPPVVAPLREAISLYGGVDPLIVGPGVKTGMPIRYDPPQDVGADRIVTAVGAWHRHAAQTPERGIIVVDFGTATTFDVVGPGPEYLGGAIAPGIGISADALFARAAKLPRVEPRRPARAVGKNTVAAIQSGLVYGYIALVEGLVTRIREEVSFDPKVVATGGFAGTVGGASPLIDVVDDALVLEGLRIIHDKNRAAGGRRHAG